MMQAVPTPAARRSPEHRASPPAVKLMGVEIVGTAHAVPSRVLTNDDLAKMVDTSDEWIVQRTGIRERRLCDPAKGETTTTLAIEALRKALVDANVKGNELDLIIVGSVTGEMTCPSTACRVAEAVGAAGAGAFDVIAACCSFVYGLNIAHDLIRVGSYKTVGVLGCDVMSSIVNYDDRATSILFGDAAGAAILRATEDTTRGMVCGRMYADGTGWRDLYIPRHSSHVPEGVDGSNFKLGTLQMNGREVYKFAVKRFSELIQETLDRAGVKVHEVDHFICHQSNARMLEAARERFGIPAEKMLMNIDRFGNCSGGSVPVVLDELRKMGKCQPGDLVMFVAFGGGLTWSSALWRV
jgi:3-oxoacyl-[acyl-carrier-protein] synthase-3